MQRGLSIIFIIFDFYKPGSHSVTQTGNLVSASPGLGLQKRITTIDFICYISRAVKNPSQNYTDPSGPSTCKAPDCRKNTSKEWKRNILVLLCLNIKDDKDIVTDIIKDDKAL